MSDKFLYERVARVESRLYACRVWCGEGYVAPIDELRTTVTNVLFYLETFDPPTSDQVAAALNEICATEGVNSVEITVRANGVGMCVHKNWP